MKKALLLIIAITLSLCGFGQSDAKSATDTAFDHGSNIVFPALTPQVVDNLDLLGRVWGFLKYHHPAIAQGQYNWDYELFRMLPAYLQISEPQQRDDYLAKWIQHYGKIPANKNVVPVDSDAFSTPDLTWINPEKLSPKLYKVLMKVYQNRFQGNNYYVAALPFGASNAKFNHENPYSEMYYPDAGFRLLSVYRYWNIIQYFFPYRYLTDTDWNDVLKESISKLLNATDAISYISAVRRMIAHIDDSHGVVYSESMSHRLNVNLPPFNVRFLQNDTLVVDSYRNPEKIDENGPHIGDVITNINHQTVKELIDSLSQYYSASNYRVKLREIARSIVCSKEPFVELDFLSNGEQKNATIPLYSFFDLDYSTTTDSVCYRLLNGNIGYISMDDITDQFLKVLADTIRNTKGLILDLREYPKEMVIDKFGMMLSDHSVPYFKATRPELKNPGTFIFTPSMDTRKGKEPYQGKIVILIDENSQSHAEFCAMYYRTITNSVVIGSNSTGADGNVSRLDLPGGIHTMFSGIGIYYPDGTETQRVGLVPDIYIYPTVQGIREGRDEILEKAIEVVSEK